MMKQNNAFSLNRLSLLYRQAIIENKREMLIYLAGLCGGLLLFMGLFIFSTTNGFRTSERWNQGDYMVSFILIFLGVGILYNSMAFPAFRSKEKTLAYLMLPATTLEKFTFEVLNKLVLYIVGFPLLFWFLVNVLGSGLNSYAPQFENYQFDLVAVIQKLNGWQRGLAFFGGMLVFTIPFAGASHFQKKTLVKTLFTLSVTLGLFLFFGYLLFKGFDLKNYHPINNRITFIYSPDDAIKYLCLAAIASNLILLTVSYLKIKEKEV
ncbi:MAG: hypothetical protein JXQ96_13570 [Cyclobacteriaceae bacterium]